MDWKSKLFAAGFATIATVGANWWLCRIARGSGVILMFHRVRPAREESFAPNRSLEVTPEFLDWIITLLDQEDFDIIPLGEVPGRLELKPLQRRFAVITFDDGYRDNIEYAWPILKRHGVPWTIFIVPDFVDGCSRPWWLELETAIARLGYIEITCAEAKLALNTRSAHEKYAAYHGLCQRLKTEPEHGLRAGISELCAQIDLDISRFVHEQFATWDEIAMLARDSEVTIGSHTRSHPMLRRHSSSFVANELKNSKSIIEKRLGRAVQHLAYPYGDSTSVGPREFSLAREAKYVTAATTRPGHVWPNHAHRLMALPRVAINGCYQSEAAVRALLSGWPFLAWS